MNEEKYMKKICVIGSFNIDIVTSVDRFPVVGETISSKSFDIFIGGGKGANQAVALGKLGADVMIAGKLGDKFYGPEYMEMIKKNNVNCDAVILEKDQFPGIAIIAVDGNSDNIIFAYPGANALVDIEYINQKWEMISSCDCFLFQFEIPLETNIYAMKKLREMGKTIILDPAPAKVFPDEVYRCVDFVTPNEVELQMLTGIHVKKESDFKAAAEKLLEKGARMVIAKAGKNGAYIVGSDEFTHVPGFKVKAVDTTAAGDSFNAGFAFALCEGKSLYDSVRFANAVAGLSTTGLGAQSAMPTIDEVNNFLSEQVL